MVRWVARVSGSALTLLVALGCGRLEERLNSRREAPGPGGSTVAPVASGAPVRPVAEPLAADAHRVPPAGYELMTVGGVAPTAQGNAVMLTDSERKVGVPIFVGGTEALSIALRLQKRRYARPLTHDLLDDVVRRLDGRIVAVRVDKLERQVFHGSVLVERAGQLSVVDARPSDAIALALGSGVPIHVAQNVIQLAGMSLDGVELQPPERLESAGAPEAEGVAL